VNDAPRAPAANVDAMISHFIPSVQLTGSRDEKLRKLDTLIHHLQQLRTVLSQGAFVSPSRGASHGHARQPWLWFASGLIAGVVLAFFAQALTRWPL
jgi:hypothetical protein